MFVFRLVKNYPHLEPKEQVAINPKSIAAIINQEKNDFNENNVIKIVLIGGAEYVVYYSDFDMLVRLVSEKV